MVDDEEINVFEIAFWWLQTPPAVGRIGFERTGRGESNRAAQEAGYAHFRTRRTAPRKAAVNDAEGFACQLIPIRDGAFERAGGIDRWSIRRSAGRGQKAF